MTNQVEFENLRFVVDAIVAQKDWQTLNNVDELWWTGLEGEAPGTMHVSSKGRFIPTV